MRPISLGCRCTSVLFSPASGSCPGLMKVAVASAAWPDGAGGPFQPSFLGFPGAGLLSRTPGCLRRLPGIALRRSCVPLSSRPLPRELPESGCAAPTARQRPHFPKPARPPAGLGNTLTCLFFPGSRQPSVASTLRTARRPCDPFARMSVCSPLPFLGRSSGRSSSWKGHPQAVLPLRWERTPQTN